MVYGTLKRGTIEGLILGYEVEWKYIVLSG